MSKKKITNELYKKLKVIYITHKELKRGRDGARYRILDHVTGNSTRKSYIQSCQKYINRNLNIII